MMMMMMEEKLVDVDSLLASHGDDYSSSDTSSSCDSEGGVNHLPRRTIDEILNDDDDDEEHYSSSSSFSALVPPLVSYPSSTTDTINAFDDNIHDNHNQDSPFHYNNNNNSNNSRFRPHAAAAALVAHPKPPPAAAEESAGEFWLRGQQRTSSLPAQQLLFGGVGLRTSAKPGAALAAAAAASRPVPTPHAAALILSRTTATPPPPPPPPPEQTPLDIPTAAPFLHTSSSTSSGNNNDVASKISPSFDGKLLKEQHDDDDDDDDAQWDSYQSAVLVQEQEPTARGTLETSFKNDASLNLGGSRISSPAEKEEAAVKLEPDEASPVNVFSFDANSYESNSTSYIGPRDDSGGCQTNVLVSDQFHDTSAKSPSTEEDDTVILQHVDATADEGRIVEDDLTVTNSQRSEFDDEAEPSSTATDAESVAKSDLVDLAENIIIHLEHKSVAKRAEKKAARPVRKPLELAEELEKKHAFSGLDWENDIASQPMKLEGVRRGSIALGYFDVSANNTITRTVSSQLFRRDQGSPQSVAVHFNFIAVGLSKGLVLVVPSKYSPHSADSMDTKMLMLGLQGDTSHPAVTSMCFNQTGDLLFAGYSDGRITVWDLQKGAAVKVVTGIHNVPVVHLLYLGQDSQVTRLYRVVSGDSKGLVWLITFSVVPWVNRFSFSTTCLLDGQTTGKALCASPLLPDEFCGGSLMSSQGNASGSSSSSSIGSVVGGVLGGDAGRKLLNEKSSAVEEGVVIFATYQSALVARVSPTVVVYAQLSRPDGVREGSMPYTAWKSMGKRNGASTDMPVEVSEKVSLLAIAWDRKVQVAKLVKSELKVYAKWTLESSAIGVAWLDDEMLVILTSNGQLCLFSKDGTMIHQTSFMVDGSGGDDLVSYHMHFTNIFGNPEKAFHNSIAVRGATIYVLGPLHLIVCRLLPWKERIQVLRKAGDWMGALNMAMSLFDGQAHGVIDLPRTVDAVQEAIMPYLVELLLSYVDEVFSYISVAFCNQIGKLEQLTSSESKANTVHSEIKEQFSRVGGVAVEFCVHIRRTDVLFDEILSKFVAVQQRDTFLELLEPYILKDMLGSLPPEVMQALVEHYSTKGWLQRVEQCVLHMDISSLDFNQVVRLCREHRLYGALVYLFNRGLDDFKAPLEELLIVLKNGDRETSAALGYRMLVYLKYCFTGLAFPPGQGSILAMRLPSLRIELVQFLLEPSNARNSSMVNGFLSSGAYVNLYHLLELDTEATLEVLRMGFVGDVVPIHDNPSNESDSENLNSKKENNLMATDGNVMVQKVVDTLVHVLDRSTVQTYKSTSSGDVEIMEAWPSRNDEGHMLEFIAYYTSCKRAVISDGVLNKILEYYTSDTNLPRSISGQKVDILRKRERQMLALLEAVPQTDWDTSCVLQLCEKSQFFQVCGLIHAIHHHYIPALDSYMKDLHEPIHAFSFISDALDKLSDTVAESFRSAVMSRIPDLIILSREDALFLVTHHFSGECQNILSELHSHPKSLFLYLKTVFEVHLSGTLSFSGLPKDENSELPNGKAREQSVKLYLRRISGFSKFLRDNPVQVTEEMSELYLELLCQYECNSVLKFLKTFENYRVEHCLRLCQGYGIVDASVFLLERVGEVGSALLLTLSGLGEKFIMLDTAVERVISDASVEHYSTILKAQEVNDIRDILHACVGLCQRNTPKLEPEESESLWFQLLDSFCESLLGSFTGELIPRGDSHGGNLVESIGVQEDEEAHEIKWKISKNHNGASILRKLFSQFIREIVEGMIGFVRLPAIMTKLLADNSGQEFGDFKLTILGMLGTYGFERRILDTAKSLIEDDTFYSMSLLKKGASRGYAPRSLVCCMCNCLLTRKFSSSSGIHLFSCGHACHLQCEITENEVSHIGPSSAGCPVCMPTKKGPKSKGKTSGLEEIGLVLNPRSKRPQQAYGNISSYPHESDAAENSHGFPQISRFDMLASLKKEQRLIQVESIPQLRLAPPAVYHEKVKKGINLSIGESGNGVAGAKKPSKSLQLGDIKLKGSSIRLPLRSNIFGKHKSSKG